MGYLDNLQGKRICNSINPSDLPEQFQDLFDSVGEWVPRYIQGLKLQEEHAKIEAERDKLLELPPARSEILEKIRRDYDAHQAKRRQIVKSLVAKIDGESVFENERAMKSLKETALPLSWEEIENAVAELPEGYTWSEIAERLAGLDAQHEYGKCHPESRYTVSFRRVEGDLATTRKRKVKYDHWQGFIEMWAKTQGTRCEPCDILGHRLEDADEDVQQAWRALRLIQCVDRDSPNLPAPIYG